MLTKLFEAIDSEILTEDMKASLKESFDSAVEVKSTELISEKIEEEKKILVEDYEKKLNEYKAESDTRISEYLDIVVENYLDKNKVELDESIKAKQVDALLEGFDALLLSGGVSLQEITEASDDEKLQKEVQELSEKVNKLVETNSDLTAKNNKLLQASLIQELSEGLSLIEEEKFENLAKVISMDEGFDQYLEKLTLLKENVQLKEKKVDESINENKKKPTDEKPSWSKFL